MKKLILAVISFLFVMGLNAQTTKSSKSTTKSVTKSTSRSAKSGKFVTKSYADKHKATTYTSKKRK